MNTKAPLLLMFGIAMFLILRNWYKTNSGLPNPSAISKPCYAFGVLLLASNFLGKAGLAFGAAMTLGLWYQSQSATAKTSTKKKANVSQPKKPGVNP